MTIYMSKSDAITEGLFDHEDERMAYEIDLAETYQRECGDMLEMLSWSDTQAAYDLWSGDEPVAEWEFDLLTGDSDGYDEYRAEFEASRPAPIVEQDDEPDLDETYPGQWLVGDVDEAFPDGGYVITGPSPSRRSVRASGYIRVYELAREVGINTTHMITALRSHGEYVNSGFAYVALPVCDRVREVGPYLVQSYGPRVTTPGDVYANAVARLEGLRERLSA